MMEVRASMGDSSLGVMPGMWYAVCWCGQIWPLNWFMAACTPEHAWNCLLEARQQTTRRHPCTLL